MNEAPGRAATRPRKGGSPPTALALEEPDEKHDNEDQGQQTHTDVHRDSHLPSSATYAKDSLTGGGATLGGKVGHVLLAVLPAVPVPRVVSHRRRDHRRGGRRRPAARRVDLP